MELEVDEIADISDMSDAERDQFVEETFGPNFMGNDIGATSLRRVVRLVDQLLDQLSGEEDDEGEDEVDPVAEALMLTFLGYINGLTSLVLSERRQSRESFMGEMALQTTEKLLASSAKMGAMHAVLIDYLNRHDGEKVDVFN